LSKIRKSSLLRKYGPNAIKKVEMAKGKCEKCGTPCIELPSWRRIRSWAIHHINFDEKDNRLKNLAFLCLDHHNDVHHFIPKKFRESFFRLWLAGGHN